MRPHSPVGRPVSTDCFPPNIQLLQLLLLHTCTGIPRTMLYLVLCLSEAKCIMRHGDKDTKKSKKIKSERKKRQKWMKSPTTGVLDGTCLSYPGLSEIGNLEHAFSTEEQIGWLDVAVE